MPESADHSAGLDSSQSELLPSLADRPLEDIEAAAVILVDVRSISAQLSPAQILEELSARLTRAGVRLPDHDLTELAHQLTPSADDEAQ